MASYVVAMSVVPLFCARTSSRVTNVEGNHAVHRRLCLERFNGWFNPKFERFLDFYDRVISVVLKRPVRSCLCSPA